MRVRLGYVGISKTIDITSSSLVTYAYFKRLGEKKGLTKVNEISLKNINSLREILKFNLANGISFFRMTSNLIPLATKHEVDINPQMFKKELREVGKFIINNNFRIDSHPDQYCVINSIHENVIENSIEILKYHADLFDLMNYPGKLIIRVGSSQGGKKEAIKRFKETFSYLEKTIQDKIIVENDDKIFTMLNTLNLCEDLRIPMVLDYHHHVCNKSGTKIENYLERIFATWQGSGQIPKMHYSSPLNKKARRSHHDYINCTDFIKFLEKIKFINQDVDIMLEAKAKDEALFKLIRELKYRTDYKFIDETSFII